MQSQIHRPRVTAGSSCGGPEGFWSLASPYITSSHPCDQICQGFSKQPSSAREPVTRSMKSLIRQTLRFIGGDPHGTSQGIAGCRDAPSLCLWPRGSNVANAVHSNALTLNMPYSHPPQGDTVGPDEQRKDVASTFCTTRIQESFP